MSKLIYWLFSKTSIGKLIDGHKRIIGFSVFVFGLLIQGLAEAAKVFPDVAWIGPVQMLVVQWATQWGELITKIGITGIAVGVASDAAYDIHAPNDPEE